MESDSAGESGIEATLVVEQEDDGSAARIVDVRLRSLDGHGLRAVDLRMLEGLGLTLSALATAPAVLPAAAVKPPRKAAKPAVKAAGKSATKSVRKAAGRKTAAEPLSEPEPVEPVKQGRTYRPSPPLEVLDAAAREHGIGLGELARHFNVPRYTITSWYERHRRNGHQFPGDPAPTMQED